MSNPIIVHPASIPIRIGGFHMDISGFGIAVLLAFLVAQIVSENELRARGHEAEASSVGDVLLAAVAGTMIGGKLYYVSIITHDWHDLLSRSGFVFWGGFIGAVIACWATIRFRKLPFATPMSPESPLRRDTPSAEPAAGPSVMIMESGIRVLCPSPSPRATRPRQSAA